MKYDCEISVHDFLGRQTGKKNPYEKLSMFRFVFQQQQKEIQCVKLFNISIKEIGVH